MGAARPEVPGPAAPGEDAVGVTRALWVALLAWTIVRAALAWAPGMAAWGLDFARTAPWPWAAAAALLSALAFVPAFARALGGAAGPAESRSPAPLTVGALALVAVVAALALTDRTYFVGDALLRVATLREPASVWTVFPQAMPLDGLLHHALPRALAARTPLSPEDGARAIGAAEAVLLALLAVRFASGFRLAPGPRLAIACAVLFGGYFALLTGYGKPTVEVVLATIATGVFGLDVVCGRGGALGVAVAVSLGVLLHRAALPLLATWLVVAAIDVRARGVRGAWPHVLPLVVMVALAPTLARVLFGFDVGVNFASREVAAQGGMWRTAFSGLRLLDVANVLLLHAPLLPVALVAARFARPGGSRAELAVLGSLVLASAPVLVFTYVTQGPFRDWDAYGGAGAAVTLASAWTLARALERARDPRALVAPMVTGAALPALLVMASQVRLDDGLARVRAVLAGPPARTASQRAATLDFLGSRLLREGRWSEAADAFATLAESSPSQRVLVFWGTSALLSHRMSEARRAFETLLARLPGDPEGRAGLWLAAAADGDRARAASAWAAMSAWAPDGPERRAVTQWFARYPMLASLMPPPGSATAPDALR